MLGSELICDLKFWLTSDDDFNEITFKSNIQKSHKRLPFECVFVCAWVCCKFPFENQTNGHLINELINTNQTEERKNIQNSHSTRKKIIPHRIQRNLNFDKTRNLFTSNQWHDERKKQFHFSVFVCFFLRLLLFAYLVLHLYSQVKSWCDTMQYAYISGSI